MNQLALTLILITVPLAAAAQTNDAPRRDEADVVVMQSPRPKRVLSVIEGEAPPPGYRAGTRPRYGLVIGGGATLAAGYGATALFAYIPALISGLFCFAGINCNAAPLLGFIPIAGPLLLSQFMHVPLGWGILGSSVQLVGALTLLSGIVFPKPVWVLERRSASPLTMSVTGAGLEAHF